MLSPSSMSPSVGSNSSVLFSTLVTDPGAPLLIIYHLSSVRGMEGAQEPS